MNPEILHHCLRRLLPHVDCARIALTGGGAISIHLDRTPAGRPPASVAPDLDFVVENLDVVAHTVTSHFLVSHYHTPQADRPNFLIQLVDPATRIRLDFFPDSLRALGRSPVADVAGFPLRLVEAADILEHKLRLLAGASEATPVEEKHYADARGLGAFCGRDVSAVAASRLIHSVYSQERDARCHRCEASRCTAFPLAPKGAILDILGYV